MSPAGLYPVQHVAQTLFKHASPVLQGALESHGQPSVPLGQPPPVPVELVELVVAPPVPVPAPPPPVDGPPPDEELVKLRVSAVHAKAATDEAASQKRRRICMGTMVKDLTPFVTEIGFWTDFRYPAPP